MNETTQPATSGPAEPTVMRKRGDPVPVRVEPGAVRVYGAFVERDYGDCLLVRVDLYSHHAILEEMPTGDEEGPSIALSADMHTLRLDETQPRGVDTVIEFHEHKGWRVFASSWSDCETLSLVLVSPAV